ncbi:cytochrome c3 family protein [Hydrogenimonas sp.]
MRTPIKLLLSGLLIGSTTIASAFGLTKEQEGGIYQTKHNLMRGINLPKGEEASELCVWCHIPHDSLSGDVQSPKWLTQSDNERNFDVYGMEANVSATGKGNGPDVMVRVCLTCHDGVNAPNISLFSPEAPQRFNLNATAGSGPLPDNSFVHSHPVGVNYAPFSPSGSRASLRPQTYILNGWSGAKTINDLVSEGTVRCTSCHDPHSTNGQFLRTKNSGSALCKGCHNK